MQGKGKKNNRGIVPRVLEAIFQKKSDFDKNKENKENKKKMIVKMCFIEIYRDQIRNLVYKTIYKLTYTILVCFETKMCVANMFLK